MIRKCTQIVFLFFILIFFSCELPLPEDKSGPTSPPVKISVSDGGQEGEVVISWKSQNLGTLFDGKPANVSIYTVEYSKQLNFANSSHLIVKGTSAKISNLDSRGTFYYFRVKANNTHIKNIQDEYSTSVRFKVGIESNATRPEEPGIPFIKSGTIFSTRVTIYWIKSQIFGAYKDGVTKAKFSKYEVQYSLKSNFNNPSTKSIFTTESTLDLDGLIPESRYYIRVRTVSDTDDKLLKYSPWVYLEEYLVTSISGAEPPSPPKNISLIGTTTTNEAILEWTPPSNLGKLEGGVTNAKLFSYELEYSLSANFAVDNKIINIQGTENRITLEGLMSAVQYFVRVRAINNNGIDNFSRGDFSIPLRGGFITQRPENALKAKRPSIPSNIRIEDITETTALIRFDAPYDFGKNKDGSLSEVRRYIIEYATKSDFSDVKQAYISNTVFLGRELVGLKVATLYYLRVKAVNDNEFIGLNTSITGGLFESFLTQEPIPPPKPIIVVSMGSSPKTSIQVNWFLNGSGARGDDSFSKITKYIIEYSDDSFKTFRTIIVTNLLVVSKQITGLTPSTTYSVRVKIVNDNRDNGEGLQNTSLPSEVDSFTTDADARKPLSPRNVNARVATPYVRGRRSIVISWMPPIDSGKKLNGSRDEIKSYIIEYSKIVDFSQKAFVEVTNPQLRIFTIDGLDINTRYFLRMKALNNNVGDNIAVSDSSSAISISTNDNSVPPSPPRYIIVANIIDDSAQLNWDLPISFGENESGVSALIEGYEIRYISSNLNIENAPWIFRNDSSVTYNLTSLNRNTEYRIEIRSLNSNVGLSKRSIPVSYTFRTLL